MEKNCNQSFRIEGNIIAISPMLVLDTNESVQSIVVEYRTYHFPHKCRIRFCGDDVKKLESLKDGDYVCVLVYIDAIIDSNGHWHNIVYASQIEKLEQGVPSILGYGPDKSVDELHWDHMGGAGYLRCIDCGKYEQVTSFIHGNGCLKGLQCQKCGHFFAEFYERNPFWIWGEKAKCPKCGSYQDKDCREKTLFCPHCKSKRLLYSMIYIT